jgi:hypothetical protein
MGPRLVGSRSASGSERLGAQPRAGGEPPQKPEAGGHEQAAKRENHAEDDQQTDQAKLERVVIVDKPVIQHASQLGQKRI